MGGSHHRYSRRQEEEAQDLSTQDSQRHGLAGLDGLEVEPRRLPRPSVPRGALRLSAEAAETIRDEVRRASGREVCFLAEVGDDRVVISPRAVARGNRSAVLAVARDAPEGSLLLHNHPARVLEPSDADLAVAARCWEEGLGTAIVDNEALDLYVIVEPPEPRVRSPLDLEETEALLGPDGPLVDLHSGYEDRVGQREMLRLVAERYNEGGVALVEAGTGTGKSLAYLVPAARWALQNDERTVISTNTINLQEQLVEKDLPLVQDLLGEEISWALVKGRGNYVSIRRARLAATSAHTLFEEDRFDELQAIVEWTRTTSDGSRSDLTFFPADESWDEVRSDPDVCLRARCPHFQECFYQRSRRRAASAQLLVVNHHLLFTDLAVRRATGNYTQSAVLPAYRHLILDEAHNLEDAATQHLGVNVTSNGLFRMLSRLDRRGKGVLSALEELAEGHDGGEGVHGRIEDRIRPVLDEVRDDATEFADSIHSFLAGHEGRGVRIGGEEGIPEPVGDDLVRLRLETLLGRLSGLERELDGLRKLIELSSELEEVLEERLLDLQSVIRRLGAYHFSLQLVFTPSEEELHSYVRWIERKGQARRRNLAFAAAPIELAPLLRESLFGKSESVVLTSATLATRSSFDFVRQRLGLDAELETEAGEPLEVIESIILSPFDFKTQAVLGVPTDLPDVRESAGRLLEETARVVRELAELTDGGLFALFTSHDALRRVAELLRESELHWPLFVQGDEPRARLLGHFIESGSGILLGTASFWEGVDVPGWPLRGLVIHKLPFRVPNEPITAARIEAIERSGGNAFWQYLLPLAALRLKQGFGRLVRSETDRGAVLLLDDRILRRRYGVYLRDSLPPAPLLKGPWSEVRRGLARFYSDEAVG